MGSRAADWVLIEKLGGDAVFQAGDRIVVESSVRMVDWEARAFRRIEVVYRGRSYAIDDIHAAPLRRTRYVLVPWSSRPDEPGGRSFVYDATFVKERDRDRRAYRVAEGFNLVLTPIEPLVGFLPARLLDIMGRHFGIHIERAHGLSIYLEYLVALVLAVGVLFLGLFPSAPGRVLLGSLLLLVDCGMRYHHRLVETPRLYGPFEWLFHWL